MRRTPVYSSSPRLFYQESHLNNLLGTLVREGESYDRRLQTADQLREWLRQVDPSKLNPKIVPKLTNAICRAFVWRQKDLRHELVECIRLLGKNLGDYIPLFFRHFRMIVDPEAQNSDHLQRFNNLFPGVPELGDEEKSMILKPTVETIQHYAAAKPEVVPVVVGELTALLTHANSADIYIPVVLMFVALLPQYVELLGPYFNDHVDVCIGWYISATQRRETVRRETERLLLLMHPLWRSNPNAVVEFLMQFSEDINKCFVQYSADKKVELLDKMFSFYEIFKIVCDSFTGGRLQVNTVISPRQAITISNRLLIDASTLLPFGDNQKLFRASFSAIASFVSLLPSAHLCELTALHHFILSKLPTVESKFHLSTTTCFLKMLSYIIRAIGSLQLGDFLQPLFATNSVLFSTIPFAENGELVEVCVDVFHAAFASKQVALVTQIYGQLVERMKLSFSKLVHGDDCDYLKEERQILFGLAALRRIATDKLDLFGVHLFTPTIFDLLSHDICPFGGVSGLESAHKLAINSGLIQTATFSLIVGHMQGHSYFVANSDLVESSQSSDTAKRTTKYLGKYLTVLAQVLSSSTEYVDPAVRHLALNSTTEVIAQIINYRPSVLRHEMISRLLDAVVRSTSFYDNESLICAVNCLSSLFPYAKFISRRIFIDLFEICLLHIGSADETVSNRVLCLVEQLAVSLQTGHLLEENAVPSASECIEGDDSLQISPFSGIMVSFSSQFRYQQFQSRSVSPAMFSMLVSYLLQATNTRPKLSSLLLDGTSSGNAVPASRFYFLSWLAALCDLANHCVLSKLKTQLGKPQDTLLALELQLKKLADEAGSPSTMKRTALNSAVIGLDQSRRLIDLLDHLERAMYNAFEGTAVVMAPPPKQIRSFFVTNRATCEEWLSRLRESALFAAWASGAYEAAIRQGMEILSDWRRMGSAFSHQVRSRLVPVTICLTRCFCKLRCPALISGLHAWCLENCGKKLSWLKPAVTFCAERYEQCINQTTQRLDDFVSDQSIALDDRLAIADFLLKLGVDCFEALHDWEAFEVWRDDISGRLRDSELEQVASEIFRAQYLSDVAGLHSFSFNSSDNDTNGIESQVSGWGFDDLVRSIRQQNIRLIALLNEQNAGAQVPQNLDNQSQQVRETVSQLFKVTTSASGLPSVACLRDLSTALMENRLTNRARDKAPDISLMASFCDDFFASNMLPDASAFGGAKNNEQLSLKSVIDVITLTKFRQHLSDSYDCGEHCLINAAAVRLARKQGLGGFASKVLLSQLQNHVYLIGGNIPPETADGCIDQLAQMPMDVLRSKCRSVFTLRCEYVKLFRDSGKSLDAANAALAFAISGLNTQQSNPAYQIVSHGCAKQLLLVAKWLQADPEFASAITTVLEKQTCSKALLAERILLLKQYMDRSLPLSKLSLGHVMNPTEHLIGQLLAMAANQSPNSSKAWMQLGGWCHFWGRKAITDAQSNGLQLSDEEYRTVVACLPPSISTDQNAFGSIVKIITRLESPVSAAADSDNNDDSDYRRDSSVTEQQLVNICPILAQAPEARAVLLAVWRAARQRLFTLYNMAAVAYFSFVNLNPQITEQTALASLRILRLLAKHAWELQAILENSLQSSPVGPWRAIVPQLFARLGHPEPYVRKAIADLLCRIAVTAPHEIVYPAVAGFYAYGGSGLTLSQSSSSPAQLVSRSQQQQSDDLKACYSTLVEALAVHNTSLVSEVCEFASELTRIAVLWDELVLNILGNHHSAISRRFSQLNDELAATSAAVDRHQLTKAEGNAVAHWKYSIHMKPVLAFFESVRKLTSSREPETDHERWFRSTLLPILESTIEALKRPRQLGKSARSSQLVVKQLLTALQQGSAGLQAAGAALNLKFMSPNLVGDKFKDASIPLPGHSVTLYAVEPQIYILPTKTKPKKIAFIGSDGKAYSYLLKGIEDLHLDERMMQLLRLVNTTFTEQPGFRARNYAVTPLGRRSGLIQWVDGVTPAFTIYKRWQQRTATQVARPAELYFGATSAILKKAGLPSETRRDKIAVSIQRRALEQLVSDTPSDLFARELWASCANAPDWFRKMSAFNKSVATMSIVGYIIGLGDRHLDNILIDIVRAEVVHIDYNVCFEKGLRLRIPEKVPFRMSQNMERALGVFGCEGLFRSACEYVMSQLRQSREVLLTLLEAFLYDPLIDWTVSENDANNAGDVGGLDHLLPRSAVVELHKGTQQQEDLSPLLDAGATRFPFRSEYTLNLTTVIMKVAEHREEIRSATGASIKESLSEFGTLLRGAETAVSEHRKAESRVATLRQCWQLVNDATARQQMTTLPQRMEAFSNIEAERASLKQTLAGALSEETEKQTLASSAVSLLTSDSALSNVVRKGQSVSFSRATASVSDFLNTTGQTQLISQLEALEREVDSEISTKFSETLAPLARETLQLFANRASPYFASTKACRFYSVGLFSEIEEALGNNDSQLLDAISAVVDAETVVADRWANYDEFLYRKWTDLRHNAAEAMEARTTAFKGDVNVLATSLQTALTEWRSDQAVASFCFVVLEWLWPNQKPLSEWMPIEDDVCGLFAPAAVVEFLLTVCRSLGDDVRSSLADEAVFTLEMATNTLGRLRSLMVSLIEACFSFVSSMVPKFYLVILSNEFPDLNKAIRSGRAEDVQLYIEHLLSDTESTSELATTVKAVSTKLTQCLSELSSGENLNTAVFPRLFITHAILCADNLASQTMSRVSPFQLNGNSSVFGEIRSCIEKLLYDPESGIMQILSLATWQLLAVFLGIANVSLNPNQPALPPDFRSAIPHLFMLDENSTFPYAVALFERFQGTFIATQTVRFSEVSAALNRSNLVLLQSVLTAFEWYNGDVLPENGGENGEMLILPTVRSVSQRFDESAECLNSILAALTVAQSRFSELCSKAHQRLKWAAGSNPDLNDTIAVFLDEKAQVVQAFADRSQHLTQLSEIFEGCRAILSDRSLSKRASVLSLAKSVVQSVKDLFKSVEEAPELSTEEQLLIDFQVITNWSSADEIAVQIAQASEAEERKYVELGDFKRKAVETATSRTGQVQRLFKPLCELSQAIMPAVVVLKRIEDVLGSSATENSSSLQYFSNLHTTMASYVDSVKRISDATSTVVGELPAFENTCSLFVALADSLATVVTLSNEALTRSCGSDDAGLVLQEFVDQWFVDHIECQVRNSPTAAVHSRPASSKSPNLPPNQQAWNQQALSVWHRIRAKLDGRDGSNKDASRLSVAEHVSLLITQSRDLDNLAAMYEGWTPWV